MKKMKDSAIEFQMPSANSLYIYCKVLTINKIVWYNIICNEGTVIKEVDHNKLKGEQEAPLNADSPSSAEQ